MPADRVESPGRFLSQDPVPLLQRYAYANDNPANFVDPSGMYSGKDAFDQLMAAERAAQEWARQILSDPCWKTRAFCEHVALVWKGSRNVDRFIQNAPATTVFVGVGSLSGGSCRIDGDLFITCTGANWGYERGGLPTAMSL